MDQPEFQIKQEESVKLIKTTKSYTWEIKLLTVDLDRLEQINNGLIQRFGGTAA